MSLILTVDGPRWRAHLESVARANPGLVPVAKGNGYGFTLGRLARKAQWLRDRGHDIPALAVGTYDELDTVARRWNGDIVVLTPWRPWIEPLEPALARRVIHTVSRADDVERFLTAEPDARFLVESMTTMKRHGLWDPELDAASAQLASRPHARLEGATAHLPLTSGETGEATMVWVFAASLGFRQLWLSHVPSAELAGLRTRSGGPETRIRIGTDLWLGDRDALDVKATVLDVHELQRGEEFGYRGRKAPKAGHLLVVSGGTAHGIGLEAPTGELSMRSRAATLAKGGLDAAGRVRSPYFIDGRQCHFAEPPHMQASMLFLPRGARVPAVGEQVDVRVRYTATDFDRIVIDG